MKKSIFILPFVAFLVSCGDSEDGAERVTTRAKETSEVKGMLEAFKLQEHRVELNGCEMLYNGKRFELGMTVSELLGVFGHYDFFNRGYYVWTGAGVAFVRNIDDAESLDSRVNYFDIYLNTTVRDENSVLLKHRKNQKNDYLLIEGVPVKKSMTAKEFFSNSNFSLSDFSISDYDYVLEYDCDGKKLSYYIGASGGWSYSGAGHLRFKSEPTFDNSNKIESINVLYSKN